MKGDIIAKLLSEISKGLKAIKKAPEAKKIQGIRDLNLEVLMETLVVTDILNDNKLLPGLFEILES